MGSVKISCKKILSQYQKDISDASELISNFCNLMDTVPVPASEQIVVFYAKSLKKG